MLLDLYKVITKNWSNSNSSLLTNKWKCKTAEGFQLVIMLIANFFSKYNRYTKSRSIAAQQLKFTHTKMVWCVKDVISLLSFFSKVYACYRRNYGSGGSNPFSFNIRLAAGSDFQFPGLEFTDCLTGLFV